MASESDTTTTTDDFEKIGLVDYLNADPRPVFVVEVSPPSLNSTSVHRIVFVNQACRVNHVWICNFAVSNLDSSSRRPRGKQDATDLLTWTRTCHSGEACRYQGTSWTCTILHDRWRIFSGADVRNDVPSTSIPGQRNRNAFDIEYECGSISSSHYQLLKSVNWDETPFGPIDTWCSELRHSTTMTLNSREPVCIIWGAERHLLYNEPFSLLIGDMHPEALGKPVWTAFKLAWEPYEALLLESERTGQSTGRKDEPMQLIRSEFGPEEAFFDYWVNPIKDADGRFLGVYNHPQEVTGQIISQRRIANLLRVGEMVSSAASLDQFWQIVLKSFDFDDSEVPFAAIYTRKTLDHAEPHLRQPCEVLRLRGSTTKHQNPVDLPSSIAFTDNSVLTFAIKETMETSAPCLISALGGTHRDDTYSVDNRPLSENARYLVCPLQVGPMPYAAWIILGLQQLRPYQKDYKDFINLLCKQIGAGATSLVSLAAERRRMESTVEKANLEAQRLTEELEVQKRDAAESAQRFYEFAKHAPVGVYTFGPNGEILFANEAWYTLFALPYKSQGDQLWRNTIHPHDLHLVDDKWQMLANHGTNHAHFEFRVRKDPTKELVEDEQCRYLSSSCFAEVDQFGGFKSVTGVIVDNTLHRTHERETAERLISALEAKRAQENFMDMVSHEMRNPLSAIIQCAEEASQIIEPHAFEKSKPMTVDEATTSLDAVNTILYCGYHQKQIIDDVLTVSKLDSNLLTLAPTETKPLSIAQQALQIYTPETRASKIQVSVNTRQDTPYHSVMIDSGRVLQILINLVGNAVKFMKGRAKRVLGINISVSTERPSTEEVGYVASTQRRSGLANPAPGQQTVFVYYSIDDTGPGLTKHETETLFGRFRQASPRTHAQYGGSGLGLFISRELAELHGGEIGLKSEPGVGSTFAFYVQGYLPLQATSPASPRPLSSLSPKIHPATLSAASQSRDPTIDPTDRTTTPDDNSALTVLIVEDNVINQNVLNRQLKRAGFKTTTADHGQEALARLRDSNLRKDRSDTPSDVPSVSVVLCDLEMPVMDGMTCVKRVREMEGQGLLAHVPMVAVTGNARYEQVQAARDAGFDDVVCKPYSIAKLVPLIKVLAERPKK